MTPRFEIDGAKVRAWRLARGISAERLSDMIGQEIAARILYTAVFDWERNKANPPPDVLAALLKIMGCSQESLTKG